MIELKKILCDLLGYAYPESDKLEQYKRFYVEICDKHMKSKHGDYHSLKHHIRVFNLYRADSAIVATTIHELAHHVDYINRGRCDHGAEFYKVFQHLLHTALNMSLFSKEDFLEANRDASDSNKIAKMITGYTPTPFGYKSERRKIIVRNCYNIKETLKENGFYYNNINKTWEKEVSEEELQNLKDILYSFDAEYDVVDATDITFVRKTYILAEKGAFEAKEELKKEGFLFDSQKKDMEKRSCGGGTLSSACTL